MDFGKKFLKLRKSAGLSQEEAAEKIGVSRQAISRWEQGMALPDAFNLATISRVFGVSIDYLINDDGDITSAEFLAVTDDKNLQSETKADNGIETTENGRNKLDKFCEKYSIIYIFSLFHSTALCLESMALILSSTYADIPDAVYYILFFGGIALSFIGIIAFEAYIRQKERRAEFRRRYYRFNVWLFSLFPLTFLFFFIILQLSQIMGETITLGSIFFVAVILYAIVCGLVTFLLRKKRKSR